MSDNRRKVKRGRKRKAKRAGAAFIILPLLMTALITLFVCINISSHKKQYKQEGIKLYNEGSFKEAEQKFIDSLDQYQWFSKETDIDTRFFLADSYVKDEEYDNAIEIYNDILDKGSKSDRKEAETLIDITKAHKALYENDLEEAEEQLRKLAESGETQEYLYLASAESRLGKDEEMIEALNKYLEDHPFDTYVCYQMSTYYLNIDDPETARIYIDEGLRCTDEDFRAEIKFNDAVYYEKKHDYKTAFEKIDTLSSEYPDNESFAAERDFLKTRLSSENEEDSGSESGE